MSSLLFLAAAAAAASLGVLGAGRLKAGLHQRRHDRWRCFVERAGLEVDEVRPAGVVAKLGNLKVTCIGLLPPLSLAFDGRITFSWAGVPDLSIATRSYLTPSANVTSDESFDTLFDSSGSPAVARAVLDHETRTALRSLLAVLRSGAVTLDADQARRLATSGQGLAGPGGVAGRLAENTRREPLASVRAGNMSQLAETFPAEAVTRELARTLIRDNDPWVRLEAAKALAEEGRPMLIALIRDEVATEVCALQALHELGDSLSRAEIRAGLERAMGLGRWQLAATWKKRLGAVRDADDVRALAAALARWRSAAEITVLDTEAERLTAMIDFLESQRSDQDEQWREHRVVELKARLHQIVADAGVPIAATITGALRRAPASEHRDTALLEALNGFWDVRLAAAAGLLLVPKHVRHLWDRPDLAAAVGTLEHADLPEAKEALLALLAHPDVNVVRAAVIQLAGVPRRDVIDALRDCAERHRGNRELEAAVRQAIAEIQSRLPGASPGQLSIAGAEAGQVSLAEEDRRGEVSLERSGSE